MSEKKRKDAVTGALDFGSRFVSACAALLATVLILYSGYVLYDSMAIEMSAFSSNSDLLKYKPSIMAQATGEEQPSLSEINPDYRAWITVIGDPASPIDYPVMQGEDDLYYASHDVYNKPSLSGAIYLAAGNRGEFSDSYNLLYGHHMDNGAMFGSLDRFREKDYFDSHKTATVITKSDTAYQVDFFAVAATDAYESRIYSVGNRMDDVLSFLKGSRDNDTGVGTKVLAADWKTAENMTKMIALSTCANADTNGRLVLFGKMTRISNKTDPTDKPTDKPTGKPTDKPTDKPTETTTGQSGGGGGGSKATPTPSPAPKVAVKLTVKFREDGQEVFPDEELIYLAGDSYYVVAPQYPGYEPDVQILRGTIEKDMTLTVTYRPKMWTMKIHYIFQDGTQAAPMYQTKLQTGEEYEVESPAIEGYKTLSLWKTGTNPGKDEQFTVIYVPEDEELKDPPTPLGLERTFMQVGVCFE